MTDTGRARVNEVKIKGKRHYELPNGEVVPSVTTFLDVLPKEALQAWKLKKISEWAVDNKDAWKDLPREAAVTVLKDSIWYDSSATDAGNIAHRILEDRARGVAESDIFIPAGFEGASRNWDRFVEEYDVEVIYVEPQLTNTVLKYSGSADLIAVVDGELSLIDYKSGNGLYGSTAYQLTAYAMCDTLNLPDGDVEAPEIQRIYGMWVRPENYALYPMEFSEATWTVVRAARTLFDLTANDWKYRGKPVNVNPVKSVGKQWGEV